MTHPRQAIRDAAVAALIAAGTAAGSNVFSSRTEALGNRVPALVVRTTGDAKHDAGGGEGDGTIDLGTNAIERAVTLVIEATATASSDADDALDALAREVELAMQADITLGGAALFLYYEDTEIEDTEGIDPPSHTAAIRYTVVYQENWT